MSPPVVRTVPPTLQELERTLGVLFIGFLVCIILYGFTFFRAYCFAFSHFERTTDFWIAESYLYFSRFPKDSIWIKLTVSVPSFPNSFPYTDVADVCRPESYGKRIGLTTVSGFILGLLVPWTRRRPLSVSRMTSVRRHSRSLFNRHHQYPKRGCSASVVNAVSDRINFRVYYYLIDQFLAPVGLLDATA